MTDRLIVGLADKVDSGWLAVARQVVETETAAEVDGMLLDLFSASAMVQVHDALNEHNAALLAGMPLAQAHEVTLRLIERTTGTRLA